MFQDLRTIEEFHAARGPDWLALHDLLGRIGNGSVGKLDPPLLAEFSRLYRSVGNDLAVARLRFPRSPVVTDLNRLVWHAHSVLYAEPRRLWVRLGVYLTAGFPRAVRRNKWFVFVTAVVFVAAVAGGIVWYMGAPEAVVSAFELPPPEEMNEAGVPLVTPGTGVYFWVSVAVNNIIVSMLAFAAGMVFCVGTLFYMAYNGLMVGAFGAYAADSDRMTDFLALVTPHGILELTLIVLAGAAGMRIGWALIAPGRRRRSKALVDAGREGLRVLVGSLLFLVVAGAIEGLVTPAGLPPVVNIAIGWLVGIGFWVYLSGAGRGPVRAVRAGRAP
ncbi:MAG: stage II sporulation protein M [Acidimicrobiia bacterium]|nr:stage II sporulation protein M [Acidimicrobiia bacterium]